MAYSPNTNKIDNAAVSGLSGTADSLAYKVHEIEKHLHNKEIWLGVSGAASETDACADNMTPFALTAAASPNYGTAIPIIGTSNLTFFSGSGNTKFDIHRVLIVSAVDAKTYKFRIVYNTTPSQTFNDALSAGQYSEFMLYVNAATGSSPTEMRNIMMPRTTFGNKVWLQCMSDGANAVSLFIAIHEYVA